MKYSDKDIIKASKGKEILDKKITLCVTGSIAAYKSIDLARELIKHGAEVYPVMTEDSTKIINPSVLEWATGNPVVIELSGGVEHIALAKNSDLVLVAPATANTIAKFAYGVADTPVTLVLSVALGYGKPIVIVPAMHGPMYDNPILQEALNRIREKGVYIIEPRIEEEKAKFPEIEDIVLEIFKILYEKDYRGLKVLVTAGPTIEYIDPVRVITNMSSGKMGMYIALEALLRGGDVTLIMGKTYINIPRGIRVITVETTKDMYNTVLEELGREKYDLFISAGAPIDYTPTDKYESKLDSRKIREIEVKLTRTPKIIEEVRKRFKDLRVIAFKAEYNLSDDELINKAIKYANELNLDLVVANDVSRKNAGFRVDTNEVFIVDKKGLIKHVPLTHKREIAKTLLDIIGERLLSKLH